MPYIPGLTEAVLIKGAIALKAKAAAVAAHAATHQATAIGAQHLSATQAQVVAHSTVSNGLQAAAAQPTATAAAVTSVGAGATAVGILANQKKGEEKRKNGKKTCPLC